MNTFVGANLDQLVTLASRFTTEASEVDRLNRVIDGTLGETMWTGMVADEFRRRWYEEFQPMLLNLQEALNEASHVITVRRDAIDRATNAFGA